MKQIVILICLLMLLFGLWLVRYRSLLNYYASLPNDKLVRIKRRISRQPYQKGTMQIISIGVFSFKTHPFPRYAYGDNLVVTGRLSSDVTDLSQPRLYLIDPSIRKVELESKYGLFAVSSLFNLLIGLRIKLMQNFSSILPEPQAALLAGILLGVKRELPDYFYEALRQTGTLHIVVASGYNVTVVSGVISSIVTKFISRRWAIPAIILGIIAYTLMAGAEPPVVRAAIMAGLAFIAQLLGKQYHGLWALGVAGVLMVFISPLMIFDVGFQLSVAATVGILLLSPIITRGLRRIKGLFGKTFVDEVGVTLGAQLSVMPILLVNFKQISWLSPLVNLLVVSLIPLIMGIGGVLGVVSLLSLAFAKVIAWLAWVPLSLFVSLVSWFESLPFGVVEVQELSWKWAMGYYFVLGFFVYRFSKGVKDGGSFRRLKR